MAFEKIADFGFKVFQIEINSSCNMECIFCAYPLRSTPKISMSLDQIKTIIDQAVEDGSLRFIAFQHYSEPLLHRDLFAAIDYAREQKIKTQVITNGLLLNDVNIDKVLFHSPDILRLSYHTTDEELYENTRGSNLPFTEYRNRIINCAAAILKRENEIQECRIDVACGPRINSYIQKFKRKVFNRDPNIVIKNNIEDIEDDIVSLIKDITCEAHIPFDVNQFQKRLATYKNDGSSASVLYEFDRVLSLTVKRHIDGRRMFNNSPVKYGKCGTNTIGILPDGRITLCCLDCNGWTSIGNAFNNKVIDILNRHSDVIRQLRKGPVIPFEQCRRCQGCSNKTSAFIRDAVNKIKS